MCFRLLIVPLAIHVNALKMASTDGPNPTDKILLKLMTISDEAFVFNFSSNSNALSSRDKIKNHLAQKLATAATSSARGPPNTAHTSTIGAPPSGTLGGGEHAAKSQSGHEGTGALSSVDIKLRGQLLSKDGQLLSLHRDLVLGGHLSEEEFWATRLARQKTPNTKQ